MSPRRVLVVGTAVVLTLATRVLAHLRPQRWLPPAISLRLWRWTAATGMAMTTAEMRKHLPTGGRQVRTDLSYAPGRDGRFDLVVPDSAAFPGPHPWVLWVHGGGWHFGEKAHPLPYLELLATHGFAGVAVNYPLAPESRYPAAPEAVNAALAHLLGRAASYGLDPQRVVLAGDSAGAQVAAETALTTTSPAHAAATGRTPALPAPALRGALLFCGIFETDALDDSDRFFSSGLESAMWALSGSRRWKESEANRLMDVRAQVTADFPPTFLAAGNADALTRRQTPPFAARLRELGVPVETYEPGTPDSPVHHEFQFRLGTPEGQEALERTLAFLRRVLVT